MRKSKTVFARKCSRRNKRYMKNRHLSDRLRIDLCSGKRVPSVYEQCLKKTNFHADEVLISPLIARERFAFYCDEWLHSRKIRIRESTHVKYENILTKHIKPEFGECLPLEINTEAVDKFTNKLLFQKALAPKTVRDILAVLNSILKYTASLSHATPSYVQICYPKIERKETRVLSRSEQERLVAYLLNDADPCKFGVLLMLIWGIRIGELCALKWKDINLEERTVRISSTLQRLHNTTVKSEHRTQIVVSAPKSNTSVRTIPLTDYAVNLILKFQVNNASAYILTGTEKLMEPRVLQYRIKKYTSCCGLNDIHAHTLRHTFATRAVEVGFEIKSLSEILGHANTTLTLERYIHSSLELKRNNMEKMFAADL